MSGPATPPGSPERPVLYRYPVELTADEQAQVLRSRAVDAERYIEWLESGEGPDPWEESSG
jgi:hypothetical protein